MSEITNIHGRKWGRGLRPWLLLPKYFAVSLIIGGIFANCVLVGVGAPIELIARIFRAQIVPATAIAILLGMGLILQHPRAFWLSRWVRLKLLLVVFIVPAAHVLSWRAVQAVRADLPGSKPRLIASLAGAFVAFVLIAVVGRLKPRLGQPYAGPERS